MATQVSLNSGAVASAGALAIQTNGTTQAVSISTGQVATLAQNPILTSGTANGVAYLNGSKALTTGSALVFDGTNVGQNGAASAWAGAGRYAYQINDTVVGYFSAKTRAEFTCNYYYNGSLDKYIQNGYAGLYLIDSTTGNHTWYTAPNNTSGANATMTNTSAMTLNTNGVLALQGASTSANGVGITFPATQSASSDANTLDDYEEGTITGLTDGSGAGLSITFNNAKYTKIGRLVYISISTIEYPVNASGAMARIDGLPFTNTAADVASSALVSNNANANRALVIASNPSVFFYATATAGATSNVQLSGATIYGFSAVYQV